MRMFQQLPLYTVTLNYKLVLEFQFKLLDFTFKTLSSLGCAYLRNSILPYHLSYVLEYF